MSKRKKATEMIPEELDQCLNSLEPEDTVPSCYFSNPDPYFKITSFPEPKERHSWFGADGHIHVKNISAYWIPKLTLTEEIGGTIYTVTGSYEGEESFLRKLERITSKKFIEKLEKQE